MPRRSQASSNSGVGALCEVRMALQPISFNVAMRKYCSASGSADRHARHVLVVACALDGIAFAVQQKPVGRVKRQCADAKFRFHAVHGLRRRLSTVVTNL